MLSAGEQLRRLLAEAGATKSSALAAAAGATKVEAQLHTHVTRLEKDRTLHRGRGSCLKMFIIFDNSTITTRK